MMLMVSSDAAQHGFFFCIFLFFTFV